MTVQYTDLVGCWDFDHLNADGTLRDFGPRDLRATAGAAGAAPTRQLSGCYTFDGGDHFALSGTSQTRFYEAMPSGPFSCVMLVEIATGCSYLFTCLDNTGGVNWWGFAVGAVAVAAATNIYIGPGTAALALEQVTTSIYQPRTYAIAITAETTPRSVIDNEARPVGWTVPPWANPVYATAHEPRIGGDVTVGQFVGCARYFSIVNRALTNDELRWWVSSLHNGRKPFCYEAA